MGIVKAAIVAAILAFSTCQVSAQDAAGRDDFIKEMGLSSYKSISFRDVQGNVVSFEQFRSLLKNGASFSTIKNPQKSEAIVQIEKAREATTVSLSEEPKLSVVPGHVVPEIGNADLDGASVVYSDKPTLVSFFFTECVPCIKEIPKVNGLAEGNPEVQFVSVTFDEASLVKDFVLKYDLKTKVVADEQRFIDALGVKTYPLYALISKDGRLLGTQSGVVLQLPKGEVLFEHWIKSKTGG